MYSSTAYLFGDELLKKSEIDEATEKLLTGTKVSQRQLTSLAVLAAFLCLREDGYLNFYIQEGKVLFITTRTLKVTRLKNPDSALDALEAALMKNITEERELHEVVYNLLEEESDDPWSAVLRFVKKGLHKKMLADEKEKEALKCLKRELAKLKKDKELYKKITGTIGDAVEARLKQSGQSRS